MEDNGNKAVSNLNKQLETAKDRIGMLEHGMEMKTTTTQKIIKTDQDSIEIGAQSTGRIKVYGNFNEAAAFAKKVEQAVKVMKAAGALIGDDDAGG